MLLESIATHRFKEKIKSFLQENGGITSNGFGTFLQGTIGKSLTWCTPNSENKTQKEIRQLGEKLNSELVTIKNEIMPQDVICEIIAEVGEWGTHTMYLVLTTSRKEYLDLS